MNVQSYGIGMGWDSEAAVDGFVPVNIASTRLWLRADIGVTLVSGKVSVWADQSGYGHDATQGTAANRPTFLPTLMNGCPGVRCPVGSPASGTMSVAISYPETSHTLIVAMTPLAASTSQSVFDAQTGRIVFAQGADVAQVGYFDGAWRKPGASANTTAPQILTWMLSGTTGQMWRNGVSLGTDGYTAHAMGGAVGLGSFYQGDVNGGGAGCDIAEVVLCNAALSTGERTLIEQYMKRRYAIS